MKKYTRNQDLSKIIKKKHAGKWIAISPSYKKVVAYADTLQELTKKVSNKDVVYLKGLFPDITYVL